MESSTNSNGAALVSRLKQNRVTSPTSEAGPVEEAVVTLPQQVRKPLGGKVNVRPKKALAKAIQNKNIPKQLTKQFHQLFPINTDEGEGVYFLMPVEHPNGETHTWIVAVGVINEACQLCQANDPTYSALTPEGWGLGGMAREHELHPWITRGKQHGLWPVKRPLEENKLSLEAYATRRADIDAHVGKWVRRADQNTFPQPPGSDPWAEPEWLSEWENGELDSYVRRAFENRVIESFDDDAAQWAIGNLGV